MKNKPIKLPEKKTINLAMHERNLNHPVVSIPLILLVLAISFVFGKFAVADRIAAASRANAALSETQNQIAILASKTENFSEIQTEYGKYSVNWMTDTEKATVDRQEAIGIVQDEIAGSAQIERFSLAENQLAIDLTGVTLNATADLVSRLESREEVASVQVYTAENQTTAGNTAVSLIITLQNEESIRQAQEAAAKKAAEAAEAAAKAAAEGGAS